MELRRPAGRPVTFADWLADQHQNGSAESRSKRPRHRNGLRSVRAVARAETIVAKYFPGPNNVQAQWAARPVRVRQAERESFAR
jgi:hypothetical protein